MSTDSVAQPTRAPWSIDWYVCREAGQELWRVPRSIGPLSVDHNHWAGSHLDVSEDDTKLIAQAPVMHDLLLRLADAVEALDGTSVENEKLVDEYRAWRASCTPSGVQPVENPPV